MERLGYGPNSWIFDNSLIRAKANIIALAIAGDDLDAENYSKNEI
jgi:hypothetical protein